MLKNKLRKILKQKRDLISIEESYIKELNISQTLKRYLETKFSSNQQLKIAGYYPIQSEVNCINIIKNLQKNFFNINFYIPKTLNIQEREMKFCKFDLDESKLKKGRFGYQLDTNIYEQNLDIILTPLVGFDTKLNRIGYGKGFYDTYFNKLGIAFECQKILEDTKFFEDEKFNVKLNGIITEERLYLDNQYKQQQIQRVIQLKQQ